MSYRPEESVSAAERDIGWTEGRNNSNPYSEWQYGSRYQPYCLSATCFWSWVAGFRFWSNCTFGEKGESYTPTYRTKAQEHGVWRNKWWKSNHGDDVEFDWGNNGLIDHVEKVKYDDGTTIITVGANTSNGVYYRRRDRTYVAGFVALSEAGQISAPAPIPFKVRPMFDPSLPLRAVLDNPNGGIWLGFEGGRVDFYPKNYPDAPRITGGMIKTDHDRQAFGTRKLARLKHRQYRDRETNELKQGYIIITTDKNEYIPQAQT